jgi:Tol biopolymer transport system component
MVSSRRVTLIAVAALLFFPAAGHAALPGLNGKIAFSSDRSGKRAIWTANPDGSGVTKIIDRSLADDREPAFGPEGSNIAFSSPVGNEDLFVALADGSRVTDLFPLNGELDNRRDPSWSPDGSKIAFYVQGIIHIVNADGTGDHAVVEGSDPSWSPDGSKIAFYHTGAGDYLDIWTIDLVSGAVTNITNRPGSDYLPDWSPDGTKIAYQGAPAGGGAIRIYLVDADGGNPAPIGPNLDSLDLRPAWSPDGTRIAFASRMDGDFDIYTMRADGTDIQQVTNDPGRDVEPTWQPLPAAVSGFYARPKGATPMYVPLVLAYQPCTSPNRNHGSPLMFGSCAPPVGNSSYLTLGTPDANGTAANGVGFVRLKAVAGAPGPPDDADVKVAAEATDVRCRVVGATTCGAANSFAGPDYAGELQVLLPLRITDRQNDAPYPLGPWPATVTDLGFSLAVPCAGTPTTTGASCTLATTTDTLVPGAIKEGARAIWGLGQVKVNDGGADGDADTTSDNQLFEVQGIFVP